jgi:hypothetical protein
MKKKGTKKRKSSSKKNLGKYKSGLEKSCADALRESGISFAYEEKQFELIPSFRFPHRYLKMTAKKKNLTDRSNSVQQPIRYTPDFMGVNGQNWVIETKGWLSSHHDFTMRWKLFLKYLVDNSLDYDVYLCRTTLQVNEAIHDILKKHGQKRVK